MRMNPEALYMRLGRLAETMPQLSWNPSEASNRWLGKLDALLAANEDHINLAALRAETSALTAAYVATDRVRAAQAITLILHRALAAAELHAPVSAQGSFILASASELISEARRIAVRVDML